MDNTSVDLNSPSPYIEANTYFHRLKRKLTYSFAFRLIRLHCPGRVVTSLLEICTGSGFFLEFCHEIYPMAELFGIEYDERLLDVTVKRARFANCVQGNAETFDLLPKKFDVIVSYQVIEHLYNPSEMLRRVKEHLNPGGLFVVTSPNLTGIGARVMGKNWHGYRDDHVSLKSLDDWVSLIESHGFQTKYQGSTFFSGIPLMNKLPLGLFNWVLLLVFGAWKWKHGESFVGAFRCN